MKAATLSLVLIGLYLSVGCSSESSDAGLSELDAVQDNLPAAFEIDPQAAEELTSFVKIAEAKLPAHQYASNALLQQLTFTEAEKASWQRRSLRVGLPWIFNDQHAPFYVAIKKGFFEAVLLDVELKEGGPARDPLKLLVGETIDVGVTSGGNAVVRLQASKTGGEVMAIGALNSDSSYIWLALDETIPQGQRSTRVIKPADFIGKTVGLQEGGEVFSAFFLKQFAMPAEHITFTRAGATPDVLLTGKIDFYGALYENQPRLLEGMGYQHWMAFRFSDYGWDDYHNTHVVLKKTFETEPMLLRRYLWAIQQAVAYMLEEPEAAADITLGFGLTTALTKEQVLRRFELQHETIRAKPGSDLLVMDLEKWNRVAGLLLMYEQIEL